MTPYKAGFHRRLEDRRQALKLTQRALASKLNITSAAVSRWENADGMPTPENVERLAEALNTTPAYLLEGVLESAESEGDELTADEADDLALETAKLIIAKRNKVPVDRVRFTVDF